MNTEKVKLARITTIGLSLNILLVDQLKFLNKYYEIHAISKYDDHLEEVKKREKVQIKSVSFRRKFHPYYDLKALIELIILIKQNKYQIIHFNTPKASLISSIAGYICNVPTRIYSVTGLRSDGSNGLSKRILEFFEKTTCKLSTTVIAESEYVFQRLITLNVNKSKIKKIHNGNINGINLTKYSITQKVNSSKYKFLFLGRICKDKGIFELVSAFKMLNGNKFELHIYGDIELTKKDKVKFKTEIKNQDNIYVYPFTSKVNETIQKHDCLVLPSYREGFSNVILQAGATGIPVLMTNVGGCHEYIRNFNGKIISSLDPNVFSNQLIEISKNHYKPNEIRKFVKSKFNRDDVIKETLKLYNTINAI